MTLDKLKGYKTLIVNVLTLVIVVGGALTGQITDAPESRDGSGALLLFEIPVNRWADAA